MRLKMILTFLAIMLGSISITSAQTKSIGSSFPTATKITRYKYKIWIRVEQEEDSNTHKVLITEMNFYANSLEVSTSWKYQSRLDFERVQAFDMKMRRVVFMQNGHLKKAKYFNLHFYKQVGISLSVINPKTGVVIRRIFA